MLNDKLQSILFKNFIQLKDLIYNVTGVDVTTAENRGNYFTSEFEKIQSHFSTDINLYFDHLVYTNYFLSQFQKIKSYKKKDFHNYLNKLKTDGKNLRGEKFEILTYAKLIDENIEFIKPKNNPDFEITINSNKVWIECTTRQTDKKGYFTESIEQVIIKKHNQGVEQNYSNLDTALHIDITKTLYNSVGESDEINNIKLKQLLKKITPKTTFGAILLIYQFYSKKNGKVYGAVFKEYNKGCNKNIKILHKSIFKTKYVNNMTAILKSYS